MKKGFTLIELMIAISIIATISMVSTVVYRTGLRSYPENFEKATIQSKLNFTSDSLADYTKRAVNTLQAYDTFNRNTNTVKSILILQIPALTDTTPPDFIYNGQVIEKDTIVYTLSGGNLVKRYYGNTHGKMAAETGTPKTILTNVSAFSCDYLDIVNGEYSRVACTITVTKNIFGRNFSVTSKKTANLRNLQ